MMMHNRLLWICAAAVLLLAILPGLQAQEPAADVSLTVDAGYGSYFREDHWLPLRVSLSNSGADLSGRLVVRPETSGSVVTSAYSAPVDLPSGSRKDVTLYIQARRGGADVVLELLDTSGERVTQQPLTLRALNTIDRLNLIVAGPGVVAPSLAAAHVAGAQSVQVVWTPAQVPDSAQSMAAVDLMLFVGADADALSARQRDAIRSWLASGGHLIVAGGAGWRQNTAGFDDLLPLRIDGSETRADFDAIARAAGVSQQGLADDEAVVASGDPAEDAQIIAQTDDGLPLIVRRAYGAGTVDYLAFDPTDEPLRSWPGLPDLWLRLAASAAPQPAWSSAAVDAQAAATAVGILPGLDLLPPVMSMVLFLLVYIALIGPLTYLLLSRLKRLEWAWLTMPLLILIFSVVAWRLGFNLRGQEVLVSRLTLVESWASSPEARVRQWIGLLPPRRGLYGLAVDDGFLRAMPALNQIGGPELSGVEIDQSDGFRVQDVTIDGGLFANFNLESATAAPAIGGRLTLTTDADGGTISLQGALSNDSDSLLRDPFILARGVALPLGDDLAPGELRVLNPGELVLAGVGRSPAAALMARHGLPASRMDQSFGFIGFHSSIIDRLSGYTELIEDDDADPIVWQQTNRQRAFLQALASSRTDLANLGSRVFLAAWADDWPRDLTLSPPDWQALDTVLYLVELDVTFERPAGAVTIAPDEVAWVVISTEGSAQGDPLNGILMSADGVMTLRLMPAPDAQLSQVDALRIDRAGDMVRGLRVELWNWRMGRWDVADAPPTGDWQITQPAPYIGPDNMLDVRLSLRDAISTVNLNHFAITQQGRF